ncbi:MAG TPA: site-specific DNA-methyltransferase [Gemmatimonadaceae bacterium]
MTEYTGRLELTWTNKAMRLWSGDDGGYEWVHPNDPRITEVRVPEEIERVGEVDESTPNLLISGDSLQALVALHRIPELAARYRGKVRLVYIDPPFNTGQAFAQYEDNLEHSVWLSMLRDRLVEIRRLLAPNGSVWVHLDDAEVHRCRAVMDEVFGASAFVTSIAWQKRTSRENRAAFSSMHDYILVYAAGGPRWFRDHRNRLPRGAGAFTNPDNDPRGPWTSVPFTAQGYRANQMYKITTPTGIVHEPPPGRCWARTEEGYRELLAEGRIYFPKNGNGRPRVKNYASEDAGLVPETLWLASDVGTNDDAKRHIMSLFPSQEPFATPKPEQLLERIIGIATNEGDIVLDCFAGSGTTAAVAHRWGAAGLPSSENMRPWKPSPRPDSGRSWRGKIQAGSPP